MLDSICFVLVNTSHPGNIGGVARALKNMGIKQLRLVEPQKYPDAQATARASGADDVLANAKVFNTLDDALAGCDLVFGASARLRKLNWPQVDPAGMVQQIFSQPAGTRIAVVLGREHSGLTNEELERCHYLVHIPSNPEYSSLNVAAAAQVLAYEIYKRVCQPNEQPLKMEAIEASIDDEPFADAQDMERFYQHLGETLTEIGFLQEEHPRKMMRRLRRLFNRARPDRVELNILRGILTTIQKRRN